MMLAFTADSIGIYAGHMIDALQKACVDRIEREVRAKSLLTTYEASSYFLTAVKLVWG
jgi:hypothetical protein